VCFLRSPSSAPCVDLAGLASDTDPPVDSLAVSLSRRTQGGTQAVPRTGIGRPRRSLGLGHFCGARQISGPTLVTFVQRLGASGASFPRRAVLTPPRISLGAWTRIRTVNSRA